MSALDNWLVNLPSGKSFVFLSVLSLILISVEAIIITVCDPYDHTIVKRFPRLKALYLFSKWGLYVIMIFNILFSKALVIAVNQMLKSRPQCPPGIDS